MQNDYFFEKGFEILIISDMVKAKAPPAPPTQPPTAAPTGRKKRASDDEDPGTQVQIFLKKQIFAQSVKHPLFLS